MKYFLKTNEFTATMQSLAGMVQMEMNADILDVRLFLNVKINTIVYYWSISAILGSY